MDTPVSYCGFICSGCPVFWATEETDPERKQKLRSEIARYGNELYGTEYTRQDIIDCKGCMDPEGRLFRGCEDCACEKLDPIFKESTDSKTRLDFIRRVIGKN